MASRSSSTTLILEWSSRQGIPNHNEIHGAERLLLHVSTMELGLSKKMELGGCCYMHRSYNWIRI
uniref:Uncharacterized protein n=1 Tax=Arundo donax TaxID=35708 RepID=A0A0A9A4H7_ARUDO